MNIKEFLSKKRHVLLRSDDGGVVSAICCPTRVSPDGKYMKLGGFFADETHGWYLVDELAKDVVSVIKEFEFFTGMDSPKKGTSFWNRMFS